MIGRASEKKKGVRISKSLLILFTIEVFLIGGVLGGEIYYLTHQTSSHGEQLSLTGVREASTNIAAVDSQGNGVLADLNVKINPGSGATFYKIKPYAQVDLQYSANTAVKVASEKSGMNLNSTDVSFTIDAGEAQIIGGPSAGAAMTITVLAAIENKEVLDNVVITGTIRSDGTIGQVGGVLAKTEAATNANKDLFLVPDGQSTVVAYKEVVKQVGPFQYTTYEPYTVDLNSYAENRDWGLEIKEVSNIDEAASFMIQ